MDLPTDLELELGAPSTLSHTHSTVQWMTPPKLKQTKRPYRIEMDVKALEKQQPVTKVLQSGRFRGHLENVLKGFLDGSGRPRQTRALHQFQSQIVPASQIEDAHYLNDSFTQNFCGGKGGGSFIIPINDLRGSAAEKYTSAECEARCKLASLYRLIDRMGWTQLIFNHISLRSPGKEEHFLLNAFGLHYSEVTASNLVKVDLKGDIIDPGTTQLGISKAGYVIHSAIHEARKDIRCIIHVHTSPGAAVSAMKCGLLRICQESMASGDISYHKYKGIVVDESEKIDLVKDLGPINKAMILRNHGLLAMGSTIEEAFITCYNLMKACETQVMALSAGIDDLIIVKEEIAKQVKAVSSESGGGVSCHDDFNIGELEFEAMMRILDNLGYNTGYPYKCQRLLIPQDRRNKKDVRIEDGEVSVRNNTRKKKNDLEEIESLSREIRMEVRRIRKERQEKQLKENQKMLMQKTQPMSIISPMTHGPVPVTGSGLSPATGIRMHYPISNGIFPGAPTTGSWTTGTGLSIGSSSISSVPVMHPAIVPTVGYGTGTGVSLGTDSAVPGLRPGLNPSVVGYGTGTGVSLGTDSAVPGLRPGLNPSMVGYGAGTRMSLGTVPAQPGMRPDLDPSMVGYGAGTKMNLGTVPEVSGIRPELYSNVVPKMNYGASLGTVPAVHSGINQGVRSEMNDAVIPATTTSSKAGMWDFLDKRIAESSPSGLKKSTEPNSNLHGSKFHSPVTNEQVLSSVQPHRIPHPHFHGDTSSASDSQLSAMPLLAHAQTHPPLQSQPLTYPSPGQPNTSNLAVQLPQDYHHIGQPYISTSHALNRSLEYADTAPPISLPSEVDMPQYKSLHFTDQQPSRLPGAEWHPLHSSRETTKPVKVKLGPNIKETVPDLNSTSSLSSTDLHSSSKLQPVQEDGGHIQNGGLDLSALQRAQTTAEAVALSTGQAVERLAYHKQQVKSHIQRRKNSGKTQDSSKTAQPPSGSNTSSSSSGSLQGSPVISKGVHHSDGPSRAQQDSTRSHIIVLHEELTGLKKAVHVAEQVAQSTGASLEKLSESLHHSPKNTV